MPAPRTVLLTGAAGGLGTLMRGLLPAYGYDLRLLDIRPIDDEPRALTADLADRDALREAVRGTDAVLHLAGISLESTFDKILKANIEGTYHLYEAAREEGVRRIVFASSNHAVGFTPRPRGDDPLIPVGTPRRPDTFYGLSKSFGEDLAQFYWDKHGIETVSVRIGSCFPEPTSVRMLSVWMSPDDGARLFHAALTAEDVRHTVVYGSSANTRLWWDLASARALGYEPRDDSERYAPKLIAEQGELDPANPDHAHLGGHFCTNPPVWPY
ncbi:MULTISPECIES: NAD(P)-dependent oxidoreductase [Streptomyces]|uniref:NAD-dependent dehydratase n=1 Tax=Streptomyces venezuelae TaxID=54571 RepID=A0A5P2BMZ1_STRVZ|nr:MULTISPECIES: NAD(P)-dependent oxidoreductase [Streptomyces]NDZ98287.1 NAD(P)-dependent oxidoreductase [Streptomyces sp. SID10116]MYY84019.1 NAD-dependent epimerase/dehydratase family protein [Streptomyces sp. SID335]MYZ18045.1 NAD-dependent epimerase/dehydratase family protein [Streptomyces sp. SID337]NDZ88116.1 NAD(P)-dependent oxidoreductase [Streptomyces sp. SID10115]NEB49453.1 NAD(P)-dependent oxidoreductase [Streptomyces sp. SID339]